MSGELLQDENGLNLEKDDDANDDADKLDDFEGEEEESTEASSNADSEVSALPTGLRKYSDYLFSANSNFVKYWNNWIILLAIYNSILIPLEVFYDDKGHSFYGGTYISFIDACVDLFFLIDIIICFRTIIIDP